MLGLSVKPLDRVFAWQGAGIHQSLIEASYYYNETIKKRQWQKISCPAKIAW